MSFYLRVFGGILIALAAFITGREYSAYASRRIAEEEGFLSLLRHVKSEIERFLTPPEGFFKNFSEQSLEKLGFLPCLRDGESMQEAYRKCEGKSALGGGAKKILGAFFSDFGKNYKDGEISRTDSFLEELSRVLEADKAGLDNNVKAVRALLAAAALGAVILLI